MNRYAYDRTNKYKRGVIMKIQSLNELLNIVIGIYYQINSTCIISDVQLRIDSPDTQQTFNSEYDLLLFLLNEINLSLENIL